MSVYYYDSSVCAKNLKIKKMISNNAFQNYKTRNHFIFDLGVVWPKVATINPSEILVVGEKKDFLFSW